jgi:hypothetical protein
MKHMKPNDSIEKCIVKIESSTVYGDRHNLNDEYEIIWDIIKFINGIETVLAHGVEFKHVPHL